MTGYPLADIIVIDDDTDDRQLFKEALELVSPQSVLHCYSSCLEAIFQMQKDINKIPEVVFIDLMMPKVDGYDCITLIKQNPLFSNAPIVVLSGTITAAGIDKLYGMGVSYFISKPPTFEKLKAVIDKMVNTPSMYSVRHQGSHFLSISMTSKNVINVTFLPYRIQGFQKGWEAIHKRKRQIAITPLLQKLNKFHALLFYPCSLLTI